MTESRYIGINLCLQPLDRVDVISSNAAAAHIASFFIAKLGQAAARLLAIPLGLFNDCMVPLGFLKRYQDAGKITYLYGLELSTKGGGQEVGQGHDCGVQRVACASGCCCFGMKDDLVLSVPYR